jgi:uncharacterized membrane protein YkvI
MFSVDVTTLAGAIALFLAAFNLPYGYYNFLRVFISLISVYGIFTRYKDSKLMTVIYFITLAIFNPIWKVVFDKGTWKVVDVLFGLVFLYLSYAPKNYRD